MRATFIVNPTSGGRTGALLATHLERRGEPVHDLRRGGLERCVAAAEGVLVACGGDGTVTAVLEAVHRCGRDLPVAVIPLGTGNDLARHLGWPSPDAVRLDACVAHVLAAPQRRLDRWLLHGPGCERAWYNYWSVGDDAAAAHRFHQIRRLQPWLMRGGAANKAMYGLCGLAEPGARLRGNLDLAVPCGTGALVCAGIPSYAGGLVLGPGIDDQDGLAELFALPMGLGLGLMLAGRRRARQLARQADFSLRFRRSVTMQVDGEPFVGPAGTWTVRHGGQVRVLAGPLALRPAGTSR